MATKIKTRFFCQECGYETAKWLGQCPGCKAWNSLVEEPVSVSAGGKEKKQVLSGVQSAPAVLNEISMEEERRTETGMGELDRVLGGGIVTGSLTLVGGDPGIGKSTLLLQMCRNLSLKKQHILYVSGEESLRQIKMRAMRIGDFSDTLELTAEMLVRSNYTDTKRLYEILTELKSRLQSSMISAGHTIAAGRAMSYTSETVAIQEILSGMDFYRLVDGLCTNWDEEKEKLPEILKRLSECMFRPENLMFDFTAEEEEQEKLFEAEAKALKKDLFTCPVDREPVHAAVSKKNEGFLSASQVQYVCRAGNYKKNGLEYTGVLRMLRGILNTDYLWNTVRVKGGAYGCMCSFGKSGDAYIASYRDPNLGKTIEAYEGIVEYVAHFSGDERSMTQAVIGTVSEMDAPMNPAAKALRALSIYLTGQTAEQLQKERDQVLDATAEDIRALAGHMKAFLEDDCLCVVGNTKKIEEEKERFGTLEQLL